MKKVRPTTGLTRLDVPLAPTIRGHCTGYGRDLGTIWVIPFAFGLLVFFMMEIEKVIVRSVKTRRQ